MSLQSTIDRVLAGDREAYRLIVEEYGPCIRACLAAHCDDSDVVDDLAQETFISAYECLGELVRGADLKPWLKGIARNKLLMHFRRTCQEHEALPELRARVVQRAAEEVWRQTRGDGPELIEALKRCLKKLPGDLLGMVEARYFKEEKVQAIGARCGKSPNAVSSMLHRGRKMLETCLERSRG